MATNLPLMQAKEKTGLPPCTSGWPAHGWLGLGLVITYRVITLERPDAVD
jgi:hypothetical protein